VHDSGKDFTLIVAVCVCWSQAELKDSENEQLSQCLEALKRELSAVSDELGRFSNRSSQLESGRRVNHIISSITDRNASSGRSSGRLSQSPALPKIAEQRRNQSGSKKMA